MLEAIVVGTFDLGEADRIVRTLSAERGRTSALARGARSSRRRFVGLFEPGNRLRLELRRGRGELPLVTGAEPVAVPQRARTDLDRLALLAYGCELCSALAPEHHPAPQLAKLLTVWLDLLEAEALPGMASRWALEAKALTFAGLAPALVRCAACGERLTAPVVFDPQAGGGLHAHCGGGRPVQVDDLMFLEALRRTPLADTPGLETPARIAWLLSDFARHQLAHDLRSRRLLEELAGEALRPD